MSNVPHVLLLHMKHLQIDYSKCYMFLLFKTLSLLLSETRKMTFV